MSDLEELERDSRNKRNRMMLKCKKLTVIMTCLKEI